MAFSTNTPLPEKINFSQTTRHESSKGLGALRFLRLLENFLETLSIVLLEIHLTICCASKQVFQ